MSIVRFGCEKTVEQNSAETEGDPNIGSTVASVELEASSEEEVRSLGFLPSIGLEPSVASSLMKAGLHRDQWKVKVCVSPLLKTPILTSTVDLLGLLMTL